MSIESRSQRKLVAVIAWIVAIAVVVAIIFFVKSCRKKELIEGTSAKSQYRVKTTAQADSFSGYCGLRSNAMRENLGTERIEFGIVPDQADYVARLRAVEKGDVPFAVFTIDSLLVAGNELGFKPGEWPVTIFLVIDETFGADAVLAYESAVKNISDLNKVNARIAAISNSPSETVDRFMISAFNLSNLQKDWLIKANSPEEIVEMAGKASRTEPTAFTTWEPYVSRILAKNPGMKVIFSTREFQGYIVDVLVVSRSFLSQSPDLVESVAKAYFRAIYAHKDSMADLVFSDFKVTGDAFTKEEAKKIAEGIRWKNLRENFAHFGLLERRDSMGLKNLEDMIFQITRVLIKTGALPEGFDPKPNTLFYPGIMKKLKSDKFHPGEAFDFLSTGKELDAIRGVTEIKPLDDSGWQSLLPVGEMHVAPIYFKRGTIELSPQSTTDLNALAELVKSMTRYYLKVIGHPTLGGDTEANKKIAKDRAEIATQYLIIRCGVERNRVKSLVVESSEKESASVSVTFELCEPTY